MLTRLFLYGLFLLIICPATAQTDGLQFKVMAVHGKVFHNGNPLKKNDVFTVYKAGELVTGFGYGGPDDWLKVMEINSGATRTCYAQQQKAGKGHYLFTRSSEDITNDNELIYFFNRPCIFLFEDDTLLCYGLRRFKTDGNRLLNVQYKARGNSITKTIGRNDSLILSREIFATENGRISSAGVDSIQLTYYDASSNKTTCPEVSPFCIYFFSDIVLQLKQMGLKQQEVFDELTEHFMSLDEIKKDRGVRNKAEAEAWLKEEIEKNWKKPKR